MSQSFNSLRRAWCKFCADPFLPPLLVGYGLLMTMAFIASSTALAGCAAAWTILIAILFNACPRGCPPGLARVLTPNFFAVRLWSGRWGIYQKRPTGHTDCRELLKSLLEDRHRLPAALTPGRYFTITHETVLKRLRQLPNAKDITVRPAYTAALASPCIRCGTKCSFALKKSNKRAFYVVTFAIEPLRKGDRW